MQTSDTPAPVKSDDTLVAILDVLRERGTARPSEIADELGIAKSTAFNHLVSLERHDFVSKDEDGYGLGLRFLDYGLASRRRHDLFDVSREKVNELAETTEERIWCVVEEHGEGVYMYGASGRHSIQTREDIGLRRPIHCIAAGKAILAHLPPERVDMIVETRGLDPLTDKTITDVDALRDELDRVREAGVAFNYEESMEGIHAIAAPVLATDGTVYGAISIGGPANRLTRDRLEGEFKDLIRGATNELEIAIRGL